MGCSSYEVTWWKGSAWKQVTLARDYDSEWCADVCTFDGRGPVDVDHMRTFAALGMALVLAHNGVLTADYEYAPGSLPDPLRAAIDYYLPRGG